MIVTINRDLLPAGLNKAKLVVSTKNGSGSTEVELLATGDDNIFKLTVDKNILDFGANANMNALSFNLTNTSFKDIEWNITHACGWIKNIKPVSNILKSGETETVVVVIDRDLLPEGENTANLIVSAKNGSGSVEIKLSAIGIDRVSKITTDCEQLNFGDNEGMNMMSFNILNTSSKNLEWEITHACTWIKEVKPTSGFLNYGKTGTIVVTIDRELLKAGINKSRLIVTTKNGNGSVEVELSAIGIDKHLAKLNILEPMNITATTAKFIGQITDAGYPDCTERGFVYSISSMPTVDNTLSKLTAPITSDNTFSCLAKGLTLDQTYYIRAYAVNSVGIAYSANQVSFKTQATLPKVEVNKASNIDIINGTAILHGTISDVGDPAYTERGFVYSHTNSQPTIYDTKVAATGTGKGLYETQASGLQTNRTYYVRAYAKNEAGIAYSANTQTISTEEILPVVQTNAATDEDKEHNSVVLHGTIEDSGTPEYTERGFVYSDVYESPTIHDNKFVVAGNGNGSFEYRATTLSATKSYYVRAYATNSKGTSYGKKIRIFPNVIILREAQLMVQPEDLGAFAYNISEAMCEQSTYEGYTDWRMPTFEEISILYINKEKIGGFTNGSYWYKSPSNNSSRIKYVFDFTKGSSIDVAEYVPYYVRAVRTLTPEE